MPQDIDWIEIGRASHPLSERHGRDAWMYAERIAIEAEHAGDVEQCRFWRAVSAALRPRTQP